MPPFGYPGWLARGHGARNASRAWSQGVALDLERALGFDVRAAEHARVVHAVGGEGVEILAVVEVQVDHRAVVLGGGDQDRRPAAPQKIVRVLGMERDGSSRQRVCAAGADRRGCGQGGEREGQETTGRHLITLTRIAGARRRKRRPRRFPRGVVTSRLLRAHAMRHIGVDDRRHHPGRSGDSCRGAAGPSPAERPPDHGGRPEQRHGRLRSSAGQDAEPRSPGAARRTVRSRLHPVSVVQPEPRVAADRAAPGLDRRRRPA